MRRKTVSLELVSYAGWDGCLRIANGTVDLVVTTEVGPRIIRYGLAGEANELCEVESQLGLRGGRKWRIYGGHRLWRAPEDRKLTYVPDNSPVEWETVPGGARLTAPTEAGTGLQKEMEVRLSPRGSRVSLLQRLTNRGGGAIEVAVWSITAMAPGGVEVVPQPARKTGLLPNRLIALWPYSRMDDPRVRWGERFVLLRQDRRRGNPFKFGIPNAAGWAAYFNRGHLYVKRCRHLPRARYPDFGVSYESYTNHFMLEMETLSPLSVLKPGEAVEHGEEWRLLVDAPSPPALGAGPAAWSRWADSIGVEATKAGRILSRR